MKLLVLLLAGQKTTPEVIAKTLGVKLDWVWAMLARLRESGLTINYDKDAKRYSVGITEAMSEGLIPKLANRFNRAMKQKSLAQPPIRFVTSQDRYTKDQFAKYLGTTPQNIQNMISGYEGQSLPEGWVAFRLTEAGRWLLQPMAKTDRGRTWTLPDNVKTGAFEYVVGSGGKMKVTGPKPAEFETCCKLVDGGLCPNHSTAVHLCNTHYYRVLRNLGKHGKDLLRELRARKADPEIIADVQKWVHKKSREKGVA